jgi:beta-lactamase class A
MRQFTSWGQVSAELALNSPGVTWSIAIDLNFLPAVRINPAEESPSASIGKIFILMAVLEQVDRGVLSLDQLVDTGETDPVTDSGIMQYLSSTSYSIADLCVLVASVSDNRAANFLLDLVGLQATQQISRNLGFIHTQVLDRIRDIRLPGQGESPSCASAGELLETVNMIVKNDRRISGTHQLRRWLSLNTDTSMVVSRFFFDPLAHAVSNQQVSDGSSTLWNKTGTDTTVRADCGSVRLNEDTWTYAALAHWEGADPKKAEEVMQDLQSLGAFMAASSQRQN